MKHASLLFIVCLAFIACTDTVGPVEEENLAEISREVNWAFVELNNFAATLKYYRADWGEDPDSIECLFPYLEFFYFNPGSDPDSTGGSYTDYTPVHKWWDFNLEFENGKVTGIYCVSRNEMIDGAGHKILYTLATAQYSGYGMKYVSPSLYPLLIEVFIHPGLLFFPDENWDPEEVTKRFLMIRQVNWGCVAIGAFYNGIKMYRQDYGRDPEHPGTLTDLEYVEISPPVRLWWNFAWSGLDPITHIHAVSTELMVGGAGDTLTFNLEIGRFEGELLEYISPWIQATFISIYPGSIRYVSGARVSD